MLRSALAQKVRQFSIHFLRMCPSDAVWSILHCPQASSLDQLGGPEPGSSDRQNPICISMNDQRRHINSGQILTEIFMPGWHASETGGGRGTRCQVPASLDSLFADPFAQQQISVVEILEKLGKESVTVCDDGLLDSFEDAAVHSLRVVRRFEQERRDSRNDDRLAHALRSVFSYVACHLAAAHREADECELT